MLVDPSIGDLLDKINSRYMLVIAVSKRARQLLEGEAPFTDAQSESKVTLASYEVVEGKVTCTM